MAVFPREVEMGTWTVKIRFLTVAVKEERERDRNKVFETLEMEPSTLLKTELGTS